MAKRENHNPSATYDSFPMFASGRARMYSCANGHSFAATSDGIDCPAKNCMAVLGEKAEVRPEPQPA